LRNGPPQDRVEAQRRHLTETWTKLKAYEQSHPEHPMRLTQAEYVRRYATEYVIASRMRAARGLGAIRAAGNARALEELRQALSLNLPADVRRAVERGLR
jgi:hypothetical protein